MPWGVAAAPDGTIFLTERDGRVRVVTAEGLRPEPVAEIPVARQDVSGLQGLALHPGFPDPPYAYLYSTRSADDGPENVITRHRLLPGGAAGYRLTDETVVLDGIPADRNHYGGRLAFGPDGKLYATTGDTRRPQLAADRRSLAGKILRLDPDGGVPADNPDPASPVFSFGHRNPQGVAWSADGTLYAPDHGPSGEFALCCRDEVNRIEPGGFYGWPLRSGGGPTGEFARLAARLPEPIEPIAASGDSETWAPGGLAVLTRDGTTNLILPELAGQQLRRLVIDPGDPDAVIREEVILEGVGRLRTAVVDPNGCVLLATSNRDDLTNPDDVGPDDDRLLRACPVPGGG